MGMTESTQRRWLYEELLDRTPPFSVMPTKFRVPLQLALMEVVGLVTAFYTSLPVKSVILGSLAIITAAIWSQMAMYMGPEIRSLRDPLSPRHEQKELAFILLNEVYLRDHPLGPVSDLWITASWGVLISCPW